MANYELMVADEIFRGRYLKSFEKAEPLTPNAVNKYAIDMRGTTTLQERSPDHGRGAEYVVPALQSQSAEVCAEHFEGENRITNRDTEDISIGEVSVAYQRERSR
jgi:hypothetical protein